jgi:WD40 repeat protein
VETGAEVLHFGEPNILNATSVAFSPNGRLLATGGLQDLRVYDLAARRVAVTWPTTAPVSAIAFSGDGRLIAAGTRVQLRGQLTDGSMVLAPVPGQSAAVAVWDLASGQRVWWAPAGQWVSAVAFSPDGRFTLASSGEEWESTGSVRMFNAANGLLVGTPLAKVDSHSAAAFSPDGEWFAAAPQQGGIGARLWKIR